VTEKEEMSHIEEATPHELQAASAMQAITSTKARYCRGCDTKDWELFASSFTEGATFDLGDFQFGRDPYSGERVVSGGVSADVLEAFTAGVTWPIEGRAQIVEFSRAGMGPVVSAHHVFAPDVDLLNASTAAVVWPMEDYTWYPSGYPVACMHGLGHYHETYELTEGQWLIRTLRLSRIRVEWH
jgi:hypothetical protein